MKRTDCIELGYISKAHGLKGEVKAVFDVHNLRDYKREKGFYLARKDEPLVFHELKVFRSQTNSGAILQFVGSEDRDAAEALRSHTIFFPIAELPELPDGHYYFFQVIGYMVEDQRHGIIGKVKGFWDGPAQDVLAVDQNGVEILVPVTDEFVFQADHAEKKLHTAIPDGLLEAYLEQ